MGDSDSPPPPPAPVIISPPPPITQTASESADAQVAAFQKLIPLLPQYAQTLTDIQRSQAPQLSQLNLQQQQQYGPQLIQSALENLKLADPTGFQVRADLGKNILGQLSPEQFGRLSDQEKRQAEQDIRAGQVSRGSGTGISDSIEEAIAKYNLGRSLQQQQLSNAGSFLSGTPPQGNFAALNQAGQTAPVGTQNVQGFSAGLFPSTNALIQNQASNYGTFADFTGGQNRLNAANYQFGVSNTSNPFLEGLAGFGGFVSPILGGAASAGKLGGFCFVAEELYGVNNEKTHRIRAFVKKHLSDKSVLGEFCRDYLERGMEWAEKIKTDVSMRLAAFEMWNKLNDEAIKEGI